MLYEFRSKQHITIDSAMYSLCIFISNFCDGQADCHTYLDEEKVYICEFYTATSHSFVGDDVFKKNRPQTHVETLHYQSVPSMEQCGPDGRLLPDVPPPRTPQSGDPPGPRPEDDPDYMPKFTFKPKYGPYTDIIENTGHTFGVFGKKAEQVPKHKSPSQRKMQRRPRGAPPPVPPKKAQSTPHLPPGGEGQRSPGVGQSQVYPPAEGSVSQPAGLDQVGHVFGIFGQQTTPDSSHMTQSDIQMSPADSHVTPGYGHVVADPGTVPREEDSLPTGSVKDIISRLNLFEERAREMDKTEAGPAGHGQERREVKLIKIASQNCYIC